MSSVTQPASVSKTALWIGWILSILPVLMLIMSAAMKFMKPPEVIEGMTKLGWEESKSIGLGICELTCTILYVIPQTSYLGAILLTGYLGGATATHIRVGDPWLHALSPAFLGVLVWLGLYLRDPRSGALAPLRS